MTAERMDIFEKTKVKQEEGKTTSMVVIVVEGKEILALNTETPKKEEQK